jgi:hypothetical protein
VLEIKRKYVQCWLFKEPFYFRSARGGAKKAMRIAIRAKVNEVCVVSQRQRRSLADDVPI